MSFLLESPESIEGIGPQRGSLLRANDIETIAEMLAAGAPRIHALLPGTSAQQIGQWFCAAVLRRIEGVTPDIAEALVVAGIRSRASLAHAGLRTLELAVHRAVERNQLDEAPSLYNLAEYQRQAWQIESKGMFAGTLQDETGSPIVGATVDIGRPETVSDAKGRFAFDRVEGGIITPVIAVAGRSRPVRTLPRAIRSGKLEGPIRYKLSNGSVSPLPPANLDEMDGQLLLPGDRYRNREIMLPLDEFREGTHFLVREFRSDGQVRLLNLYRKRLDDVTLIERALVTQDNLPGGAEIGQVLQLEAGRLVATDLTQSDVASLKYEKWKQSTPSRTRSALIL